MCSDKNPSFPPIAEGDSVPCDPTAPSFLTTFPAEVRNAVYDVLFHVPDGIRVVFDQHCTFEDKELGREIAAFLPMLSTCRQIYQEAATTLFSNNIWIVSRDAASMSHWRLERGAIEEARDAACMLQGFGSRKTMVRAVLLDLDTTCPVPCQIHGVQPRNHLGRRFDEYEHTIEIWNLITEMEHTPDLRVEFVHDKCASFYDFHVSNSSGQVDIGVQLDLLNTTAQTFREDPIGLRKYGRQISEVYIERDCSQAHVMFYTPNVCFEDMVKLRIDISDGGKKLTWVRPETKSLTFMNLPSPLRRIILDKVSFTDNGNHRSKDLDMIWDLDKKTLTGGSLITGAICQAIRFQYYGAIWGNKHHTFKMSTRQPRTNFDGFGKLEHLMPEHNYSPLVPYGNPFQTWRARFLLEFDIPAAVPLEDVRLNIVKLLQITGGLMGYAKITISIAGEGGIPRAEETMNLWMCRTLVLTALADAGERHRELSVRRPCSAVWMNGRFEVVEVEPREDSDLQFDEYW